VEGFRSSTNFNPEKLPEYETQCGELIRLENYVMQREVELPA
jgi:hypothetical protein